MRGSDVEHRIRQIPWVEPSPELRMRVVDAAPAVGRVTWSDRVWFSRAFRIAAAATVAGAIALESLLPPPGIDTRDPSAAAVADAQVVDDSGRALGLPPDLAAALARRALAIDARARVADRQARLALQALDAAGERR